jgi:hypothetical protein
MSFELEGQEHGTFPLDEPALAAALDVLISAGEA